MRNFVREVLVGLKSNPRFYILWSRVVTIRTFLMSFKLAVNQSKFGEKTALSWLILNLYWCLAFRKVSVCVCVCLISVPELLALVEVVWTELYKSLLLKCLDSRVHTSLLLFSHDVIGWICTFVFWKLVHLTSKNQDDDHFIRANR